MTLSVKMGNYWQVASYPLCTTLRTWCANIWHQLQYCIEATTKDFGCNISKLEHRAYSNEESSIRNWCHTSRRARNVLKRSQIRRRCCYCTGSRKMLLHRKSRPYSPCGTWLEHTLKKYCSIVRNQLYMVNARCLCSNHVPHKRCGRRHFTCKLSIGLA